MRWKALQLALWTLGTSLCAVSCLAVDSQAASIPQASDLPHVLNAWPWLALGTIVLLLAVIALAARRRLPFGPR